MADKRHFAKPPPHVQPLPTADQGARSTASPLSALGRAALRSGVCGWRVPGSRLGSQPVSVLPVTCSQESESSRRCPVLPVLFCSPSGRFPGARMAMSAAAGPRAGGRGRVEHVPAPSAAAASRQRLSWGVLWTPSHFVSWVREPEGRRAGGALMEEGRFGVRRPAGGRTEGDVGRGARFAPPRAPFSAGARVAHARQGAGAAPRSTRATR